MIWFKKKKTAKRPKKPTFRPKDARPKPFWGLLWLVLTILTLVSVWDYSPEQSSRFTTEIADNLVGTFGVRIAFWSLLLVGRAVWLVPFFLGWISYMYFFSHSHKLEFTKYLAIFICLLSAGGLANLYEVTYIDPSTLHQFSQDYFPEGIGGWFGSLIFKGFLQKTLGTFGSIVVLIVMFLGAGLFVLHDNLGVILFTSRKKLGQWLQARKELLEQEKAVLQKAKKRATAEKGKPVIKPKQQKARNLKIISVTGSKSNKPSAPTEKSGQKSGEQKSPDRKSGSSLLGKLESKSGKDKNDNSKANTASETIESVESAGKLKIVAGSTTKKSHAPLPEKLGDYIFPPLELLRESESTTDEDRTEEHEKVAETLVRTLGEFGVNVTIDEVHTGPVITRYDVHPAAGVRVEKILNLDKNIALGLKALSVRILAPVPGKGCVGIEVPNRSPSLVCLREILESEDWVQSKAEIPIALGREVSGKPVVDDLARMPHLLIAGATGSGKTVCINAIISSLLYHFSPEDLRFVMIDPKIVEMQIFNDLPHMLIPVVTDPKKVPNALKYLIREMEKRYHIFHKIGVRNISGFNAKRAKDSEAEKLALQQEAALTPEERAAISSIEVPRDDDIEIPDKLPYIICIVDELADLMMVAPAEVETGITRLAQIARATGIHLIIATQRPSVNVITGLIKANMPSRIAFRVTSNVDSRTILDSMGANHLIGRGDMLFIPPDKPDMVRSQGAFVSDEEINAVVDHIKQNGAPSFDEEFQKKVESGSDGEEEADNTDIIEDKLLPDALEVIRTSRRASTSMLQRRLRIGYNRAARIMEDLERRGFVGPDNGSQPREILKDVESLYL